MPPGAMLARRNSSWRGDSTAACSRMRFADDAIGVVARRGPVHFGGVGTEVRHQPIEEEVASCFVQRQVRRQRVGGQAPSRHFALLGQQGVAQSQCAAGALFGLRTADEGAEERGRRRLLSGTGGSVPIVAHRPPCQEQVACYIRPPGVASSVAHGRARARRHAWNTEGIPAEDTVRRPRGTQHAHATFSICEDAGRRTGGVGRCRPGPARAAGPQMRGDGPPPAAKPFSITRPIPLWTRWWRPTRRRSCSPPGSASTKGPVWVRRESGATCWSAACWTT